MVIETEIKREFIINDKGQKLVLSDPDPIWTIEEVLNFYSTSYPILTTAKINGPVRTDDTWQFTFESVIGTKG